MTVSQVELQREHDGEINIREIKALFQDVSQLLDVNFFINQSELSKDHDIEKIAQVIKARNYEKVKKQISVFDARIKHTLDNMKVNQDKLMTEYNAHIRNIQVSDVRTNTVLMNLRSQGAYDEADDFFKKQLEARKNIMDRAENIKNKYDDEVSKFNDKKIELQEQLDKIMENVKHAFDQDIVALIGNLNQIVISNIRNEEVFKAFILGNLTKVIYTFLYNMIDSIAAQRDITRIIDGMNVEISKIVDGNTESLKRGFINKAEYLNKCYTINKSLFNELESSINSLPYKQCEDRRPTIENILRISKEKKFVFTDIIDPEKLNNIKKEIELLNQTFKSHLMKVKLF